MELNDIRQAFVDRLNTLCDELRIPPGHGRQTALGKRFGVTPKAARKWLTGQSYPEMQTAVRMCEEGKVSVLWLLQGTPPMRGSNIDPATAVLSEALLALPAENRNQVLDYLRFQFESHRGWFTNETIGRYIRDIDRVKARPTESPASDKSLPDHHPGKHHALAS